MTKEEFLIKDKKINKIIKETENFSIFQFVNKIADLELEKDNLIKYLEDKSISITKLEKGIGIVDIKKEVLKMIKSGKYE